MNQDRVKRIRESGSDTIIWIIGLEGESKEKVKDYIMGQGIKSFLLHHGNIELEPETQDKIKVLKRVLQTFDGDIEAINFGDTDEGR